MVLDRGEHIVQTMLSDTILALCRNTLPYSQHFAVEALIGITLDDKQIFLININEKIEKEGMNKSPSKRKLDKEKEEQSEGNSSSSQDSDSDSNGESRRKKKRKRRKRSEESDVEHKKNEEDSQGSQVHESPVHESQNNRGSSLSSESEKETNENLNESDIKNESDSQLSSQVKVENQEDDDDDLVFIKEEPKDLGAECSYGGGGGGVGDMYGENTSQVSLGQLQELALQLSSDVSTSVPTHGNMNSSLASMSSPQFSSSVAVNTASSDVAFHGNYSSNLMTEHAGAKGQRMPYDENIVKVAAPYTGAVYYQCALCGKKNNDKNDLKKHMRIHSGEKPYTCELCLRSFSVNSNWRRHRRVVHNL